MAPHHKSKIPVGTSNNKYYGPWQDLERKSRLLRIGIQISYNSRTTLPVWSLLKIISSPLMRLWLEELLFGLLLEEGELVDEQLLRRWDDERLFR